MKTLRKRQPPESLETLMDDLQRFNEPAKDPSVTGPFNMVEKLSLHPSSQKMVDYASESDSEEEMPTAEHTVRQEDDSDAESIDSDEDDPLRCNLVIGCTFFSYIFNNLFFTDMQEFIHQKRLSCLPEIN